MVDFGKLKSKKVNRIGSLPRPEEASNNLLQPELAPAGIIKKSRKKTGRIEQFATRVNSGFIEDFEIICSISTPKKKKTELLEEMLDLYIKTNNIEPRLKAFKKIINR